MMDSSPRFGNMALTMVCLRSKLKQQEPFYCRSYAMGIDEALPQITAEPALPPPSTLLPKLELRT